MGREEIKEIVGMKLFSFCNFQLKQVMKQFLEDQTRAFFEYSTRDKSSSSECP